MDRFYKKIFECARRTQLALELAYNGNVGIHEVMKFYQIASPDEIEQFEKLINSNRIKEAWDFIQSVVKVKLHGL